MRRISMALASLLLSNCATISKDNRERAHLHMQIGMGYLMQGQYPGAMSELLKAEKLDDRDPEILNNVGLAFYVRGKKQVAEGKFRQAVKLDPRYSEAKNNLARVLIDEDKQKEALRWLHEVEGDLTYSAQDKTLGNLGLAYFTLGEYDRAEDYLSRSLQIRRESCTPANFYGRTLLELKRLPQAAQALDQAVDFCRQARFEDPLYYSAMSYFSQGEREKSRARLEELLKDYPKSKYVAQAKGMLELLQQ